LDMGEVRVGIAITDESNLIALPHKTIFLKDLIKNLKDICEKDCHYEGIPIYHPVFLSFRVS